MRKPRQIVIGFIISYRRSPGPLNGPLIVRYRPKDSDKALPRAQPSPAVALAVTRPAMMIGWNPRCCIVTGNRSA